MLAWEFDKFGDPDTLRMVARERPRPGPDEALVAIEAAAINPSDVKNVAGRMAQTTLPRVPGRDYAGVVIEGPSDWIGAEVWGSGNAGFTRDGSHAELMLVPAQGLRRRPRGLRAVAAASVGVPFITAWKGLDAARLKPGETVVVIGIGGSVGRAAASLARSTGARVIGVMRPRPGREATPIPGAEAVIVAEQERMAGAVRDVTGGGAEIVFDTVGGSLFETALACLARGGRLVEIAAGDQRRVEFDLADFYHNESRLLGVDSLQLGLVEAADVLDRIAPGFEDGSLQAPGIEAVLALQQAQEGYRRVAAGARGRIVLVASGSDA